ncbi:group III truncated hemoglobin [Arcticibacter sp. MXS-1]|uniref:group III truncated hemoglobin n=1 Tax=Arcticibacter sp. MXS-1 TaxID=3341726 RepID=UPI0035A978D9
MKKDIKNDQDIKLLVDSFYLRVREDALIGYIFNDVAKVNWESHLPKMYDFWETVLFGERGFKGNPMDVHFKLNSIYPLTGEHFNRWKALFFATVDDLFAGETAEQAKQKASSIADLMLFKIEGKLIRRS